MSHRIQVHIVGENPVVLEVEELPKPTDQWIIGMNPLSREGKEVHYILQEVDQIMYPAWRINFIQVLPSHDAEDIDSFIRE